MLTWHSMQSSAGPSTAPAELVPSRTYGEWTHGYKAKQSEHHVSAPSHRNTAAQRHSSGNYTGVATAALEELNFCKVKCPSYPAIRVLLD